MTLQQFRYAITIAEAGSFNKAAEQLYVSQPSLTGAIRDLEKELNIEIFHRSGKGVTLTNDGFEFLAYARQIMDQYETMLEKYGTVATLKKKFGVSCQHYSFAVRSFVEMVKQFDTVEYEFALRETKTKEVIEDVAACRSEIGVLYCSDFNRRVLTKLFRSNDLVFHPLVTCKVFVYLWKHHPLATESVLQMEQLADYPCLSFEQREDNSFYLAEEIFSMRDTPRMVKVNDRATMLNLMVGLKGYTLCSGIICEELNGTEFVAVPLAAEEEENCDQMEIGYIVKKNQILSRMGQLYIDEMKRYFLQE